LPTEQRLVEEERRAPSKRYIIPLFAVVLGSHLHVGTSILRPYDETQLTDFFILCAV
jgi:hypothetical protein